MVEGAGPAGELGVGIVGVGSASSWAREAHVPAVHAAPGLRLRAVATRDAATVAQTAAELGADVGYADAQDLVDDPSVDVVTVGVPVPAHRDLILAALAAGRHVVTEWPVGTSTAQTAELAAAATAAGVRTAVDLQARLAPAAVRARRLLADGALGRVTAVSVYSSTAAFGPVVPAGARYLEDPKSGMNLTTIQAAHTLDLVASLFGGLASFATLRTVQHPDVTVAGSDPVDHLRRTVPDHVLVQGRLLSGAALAVEVSGGRAPEAPFRLEVRGERGSLVLSGGGPRGFQASRLRLERDGSVEVLDEAGTQDLPDPVVNVARVYATFAAELRGGGTGESESAPDFDDALRLAHLLDDLVRSDEERRTVEPPAPWPR
ncbi:Gfo/Idh/MocA family protein [Microlunatus antarcticus]|uniref:Putative dehydrogenase n=1 Tax=Microlunatus antarcticus TaxID=53388 RepID=A0A7W5JZG7_9ACTN|nr:Gfo/Idh/MocA family oxidoreductase [Microlunatus antarcticus]MBB3329160.1 putative dehydrogenase [Microlunatus antarcticus]